jgi:hypothetical protein
MQKDTQSAKNRAPLQLAAGLLALSALGALFGAQSSRSQELTGVSQGAEQSRRESAERADKMQREHTAKQQAYIQKAQDTQLKHRHHYCALVITPLLNSVPDLTSFQMILGRSESLLSIMDKRQE